MQIPRDDALLDLFKQRLVKNLTDEGIEAIKPKIEEAARKAVADMRVAIERSFDTMAHDLVIALIVK